MQTLAVQRLAPVTVPARLTDLVPAASVSGPVDGVALSGTTRPVTNGVSIARLCGAIGAAGGAAGLGFATASLTGPIATVAGAIHGGVALMAVGALTGGLVASAISKKSGAVLTGAISGAVLGGVGGALVGLRIGASYGNVLGFVAGGVIGAGLGWVIGRGIESVID